MPRALIVALFVVLVGIWFVIDENRPISEKIGLIFIVGALYFCYRYFFNGPPLLDYLSRYLPIE